VPSVSSSIDTDIWLWYNTTGTDSQPAVSGTYGRDNVWTEYGAVFHLDEDPSGAAPQMIDSTGNQDGTSNGTMTSGDEIAVTVDNGLQFDGTDDYISVADHAGLATPKTIELWARPDSAGDEAIMSQTDNTDATDGWWLRFNSDSHAIQFSFDDQDFISGEESYADNTLHHIALLIDSATDNIDYHIDGAFDVGTDTAGATYNDSTTALLIGTNDNLYETNPGQVTVDELRFSGTLKNAAWVNAGYDNQNSPSTFVVDSTPVAVGGGGPTGIEIFRRRIEARRQ